MYFNEPFNLHAAHIGTFWKMLGAEFPVTETQPALAPLFASNVAFGQPLPFGVPPVMFSAMPRAWFMNDERSHLVQLQGDRIIFNWRRGGGTNQYPSYEFVIKTFKKVYRTYLRFVEKTCPDEALKINGVELFYVNQIDKAHGYDGIANLSCLLKDFVGGGNSTLGFISALNTNVTFDLPKGDGQLTLSIQHGQSTETGEEVARVDLVARRFVNDITTKDIWKWFDRAHLSIVNGFTDLTTDKAHELWGRHK